MRVLVADRFSEAARDSLAADGLSVFYAPDVRDDTLKQEIADTQATILVVRSTRVTSEMLQTGCLELVIRAGAGYNTIDVDTAKSLNIYVANCPGKNSNAVTEIAFGLIFALDRQITANISDLRRGIWRKAAYSSARGLAGSTLGLVGLGRIGRAMIPRAKAFGMRVIGWSRSLTDADAAALGIERKTSPIEVAKAADVVSLHVSLTDDTRGLITAELIDDLPHGSLVVQVTRAAVCDTDALYRRVLNDELALAADVFAEEPVPLDSPLLGRHNVVHTPHNAGRTRDANHAWVDDQLARFKPRA